MFHTTCMKVMVLLLLTYLMLDKVRSYCGAEENCSGHGNCIDNYGHPYMESVDSSQLTDNHKWTIRITYFSLERVLFKIQPSKDLTKVLDANLQHSSPFIWNPGDNERGRELTTTGRLFPTKISTCFLKVASVGPISPLTKDTIFNRVLIGASETGNLPRYVIAPTSITTSQQWYLRRVPGT